MKLLNVITINRPEDCSECPFFNHDSDEGTHCKYSGERIKTDSYPEGIMKQGLNCAFIEKD